MCDNDYHFRAYLRSIKVFIVSIKDCDSDRSVNTFTCCDVCDAKEASWIELNHIERLQSTTRMLGSTDKDHL